MLFEENRVEIRVTIEEAAIKIRRISSYRPTEATIYAYCPAVKEVMQPRKP